MKAEGLSGMGNDRKHLKWNERSVGAMPGSLRTMEDADEE